MNKIILSLLLLLISALLAGQLQDKIKPVNAWSSFMGCCKACSDYLGLGHSAAWIYGVSGYAWLINIHGELCPSGPTAFDNSFLASNSRALGLEFESFCFARDDSTLAANQMLAHKSMNAALAGGKPSFAWELDLPEYYLLAGTDERGYFFFDFDGSIKHCPLDKIATSETDIMGDFHSLSRLEDIPTALQQVRSALAWLRVYNADPAALALPGYTMGTGAYDAWIKALHGGVYDSMGAAYNAQVWAESRHYAAAFVKEIKTRLGDGYDYSKLDKASGFFDILAKSLGEVAGIHAFPPNPENFTPETARQAVELLTRARDAEREGIKALLEFAVQIN